MTQQEFDSKRVQLRNELETIMTAHKERLEDFVQYLQNIGDFRLNRCTPDYFTIQLYKDNESVFGAYWEVYVDYDWGKKETYVRASIGTAGSFPVGKDSERELLYIAFARFLSDVREVGLDKDLIRYREQATKVFRSFSKLCSEAGKKEFEENLWAD